MTAFAFHDDSLCLHTKITEIQLVCNVAADTHRLATERNLSADPSVVSATTGSNPPDDTNVDDGESDLNHGILFMER